MIRVNTYCLLKNESCDLHSTIVSFNLNPEPWLRLKDQEAKQKCRLDTETETKSKHATHREQSRLLSRTQRRHRNLKTRNYKLNTNTK